MKSRSDKPVKIEMGGLGDDRGIVESPSMTARNGSGRVIGSLVRRLNDGFLVFVTHGHERTVRAKKNIVASLAIKGGSVLVSFLLVPLTLNYIDPTQYGLWLTVSSIVAWVGLFDIGLGNGLRNKLAEALALENYDVAKKYVSTTYAVLILIIGSVYVVFLVLNHVIDWSVVLNAPPQLSLELARVVFVLFTFFCLEFVFRLIGTIFVASQTPAASDAIGLAGNVVALGGIFLLTKLTSGSLFLVSVVYSASPVLVFILASLWFYRGRFEKIRPNFGSVDLHLFKDLGGLGIQFFILQISAMVVFSTDNVIIAQVLGPSEVTPYNIAYKYFGIIAMLFWIVLSPFWSAYTQAFAKGDLEWIRRSIKTLVMIWVGAGVMAIVMLVAAEDFYLLWVGSRIEVPFLLSALMCVYSLITAWSSIFTYFINGTGKIRLQMYYGVVAMVINVPISIYFARNLGLGSAGVILGTCVSLLFGFVLGPIQYYKIINGKAEGVWAK